jgi:hypothetical protein
MNEDEIETLKRGVRLFETEYTNRTGTKSKAWIKHGTLHSKDGWYVRTQRDTKVLASWVFKESLPEAITYMRKLIDRSKAREERKNRVSATRARYGGDVV